MFFFAPRGCVCVFCFLFRVAPGGQTPRNLDLKSVPVSQSTLPAVIIYLQYPSAARGELLQLYRCPTINRMGRVMSQVFFQNENDSDGQELSVKEPHRL